MIQFFRSTHGAKTRPCRAVDPGGQPRLRAALALAAAALVGIISSAAPALAAPDGAPAGSDPASAVTPEQQASALARPAVVYLEVYWTGWVRDPSDGSYFNGGDPIEVVTTCTGFNVNPDGYIATAGHCVDSGPEGAANMLISEVVDQLVDAGVDVDPAELYAYGLANWVVEGEVAGSPPDQQIFVQWGVAESGLTSGRVEQARVVDYRPVSQGGVALLKIDESNLPALEVAPGTDVEIGSHMLAVGYPASAEGVTDATLEPTNKDGTVSAKRTDGGVPVYEVSAAATAGMSGGPAVDTQGRAIGLVSRAPAGETQAFNFIAPSDALLELLARNGVANELGPVDTAYRKGLELFFAGHYRAASDQFDQALALMPSHQQAQEYKQKAAAAIAEGKDVPVEESKAAGPAQKPKPARKTGSSSTVPIALAGLATVGGGGASLLILARRRRQPVPGPIPAGDGGPVLANGDTWPAPSWPPSPEAVREPAGAGSQEPTAGSNGASADGSELTVDLRDSAATVALAERDARGFCGGCGARRQAESAFCADCGTRLN